MTMTDFAISVFRLTNERGYCAPHLSIGYKESDTDAEWTIHCGGTRAYFIRYAAPLQLDPDEQAADSHFMVDRLLGAFMLGGVGLFKAQATGRLFFSANEGEAKWTSETDFPDEIFGSHPDPTAVEAVKDWYGAICTHHVLRRAVKDAYLALCHPHEALFFAYRGMEWIVVGLKISWEELAADMGIDMKALRDFKKDANVEGGGRHPTQTGTKYRANLRNYSNWVTCLFDAINAARKRLEPTFTLKTPKELAAAFARAVPTRPYD
jgi:hypothetical protein